MYLHLGMDTVVKDEDIIGIFDMDSTTVSKRTRDFLNKAQRDGDVISVAEDLPRSFVVCRDKTRSSGRAVYLSQITPQTLMRRGKNL